MKTASVDPYARELSFLEDIELLKEKGILTEHLLDLLWEDVDPTLHNHILNIMERFGLQSPVVDPENAAPLLATLEGKAYHVPMCISRKESCLSPELPNDFVLMPVLFACAFLPIAFFGRIVVWLMQIYKPPDPEIDLLHARFSCYKQIFFVELGYSPKGIMVSIIAPEPSSARGLPSITEVAQQLLRTVVEQLEKLQGQDCPGLRWHLEFPCPSLPNESRHQPPVKVTQNTSYHWINANLSPQQSLEPIEEETGGTILLGKHLCSECKSRFCIPREWLCWLGYSRALDLQVGEEPITVAVAATGRRGKHRRELPVEIAEDQQPEESGELDYGRRKKRKRAKRKDVPESQEAPTSSASSQVDLPYTAGKRRPRGHHRKVNLWEKAIQPMHSILIRRLTNTGDIRSRCYSKKLITLSDYDELVARDQNRTRHNEELLRRLEGDNPKQFHGFVSILRKFPKYKDIVDKIEELQRLSD